jgi:glucose/mannose transport system permease protein
MPAGRVRPARLTVVRWGATTRLQGSGVTVVFNPNDQPVTVALNNLNGSQSVDWTVVMAAAVLSALPTALVYIFLGRFFIRGLLAGSMKG